MQVLHAHLHEIPQPMYKANPSAETTPEFEALIVESADPKGPYGAKEAGEGPLHPAIPAIANAIHDAVGIRLRRTPFSPAKVLEALRAQASQGTSDPTEGPRPAAADKAT